MGVIEQISIAWISIFSVQFNPIFQVIKEAIPHT